MRRRRGLMFIVFSLGLGGAAAWAANDWVSDRLTLADDSEGTTTVVIAALEIPYGTKIEGRHVKLARLPNDSVPAGFYATTDLVEGKVATTEISRGETLLNTRLADHAGGSTLAALVSANMRAVTVRVDDVVGVAGFLLPGNRVDVLATKLNRQLGKAKTDTILQNIKVLAVDQTAATQQNEPVIVRAVTLELSPSQSEELVRAKEEGSIQLTLRNPLEQQIVKEEVAPTVVKKAPALAVRKPVVRRKTATTVTVIRGTQVDKFKTKS